MSEGLDLFGQVAVTWPEIYAWCEGVAGIDRDSPRLAGYVAAWDVPGKIARAKLADGAADRRAQPGVNGSRLRQAAKSGLG